MSERRKEWRVGWCECGVSSDASYRRAALGRIFHIQTLFQVSRSRSSTREKISFVVQCIFHSFSPVRKNSNSALWSSSHHGRIKGTRRSRTRARSESSTSPTLRPAIESSSSSTLLASSMMVHIDEDLVAKRTRCRQAIDWLQSHAHDGLMRRR